MLYSPFKVFHHRDKIDMLRAGEQPVPAQVQLIITNRCNHNCQFCAYRSSGYSSNQMFDTRDEMQTDKCFEILDDCEEMGVGAIQITGGGEPTVHRDHESIIQGVLDRNMDLGLVTNGNRLSDRLAGTLSKSTWVRVSVDAGNADTYSKLRHVQPIAFHRAIDNIKTLVDVSRAGPVIGMGFVVCKENYREIIQVTELARDLGVDNLRISAVFQSDGARYFDGIADEIAEQCKAAKAMETDSFTVFSNFGARLSDLEGEHPAHKFCGIQHFVTYVAADLNVYRCCVLAYNERGLIGSIRDQRFSDLWQSIDKYDAFESFDARGCPRCMFNDKNGTIRYAMATDPPHVNFV